MLNEILVTTPETEIVTTRIFQYPIELAFRAWSEPEQLKKWWGPNGFTNTFIEFDFKVGGRWKFIMHGPDKGNYENECEFIKIEKPTCIAWKRYSKPHFQVLVKFESITDRQTKIIFKMLFATEDECNKIKNFVIDKNEENFDRLEKVLAQL